MARGDELCVEARQQKLILMDKLKLSRLFMMSTIILIAAFQCYWIMRLYNDEKQNLAKETDVLFRDVVYKLQLQRFRNDTVFFKKGMPDNLFVFDVIDSVREKFIDSSLRADSGKMERQVMISVNNIRDSMPGVQGGFVTGTTEDFNMPVPTPGGPPHVIKYFSHSRSINDTLPLQKIDSAYKVELKKNDIDIPFIIKESAGKTNRSNTENSTGEMKTNVTFVGLSRAYAYQAVFENPFATILKKISLPVLVSILLIAFTIISFVFLYRYLLAQRKLTAIKNEFISNITHELKTPIATVNVAIEALRNFNALQSPERTKEYLDISAAELERLSLLVDKVLRLSMFENKDIALNKEEFDLKELIQVVIGSMKLQFEKQHAVLNFNANDENFIIEADKLHITSAIYNLLDNALKYSNGKPVIDIQLSLLPHDIVELKVIDKGIGIAKEYQGKIFDKFFRVPAGNEHSIKGYGLGLSYVSEIVHRHMGFIVVDSELGKGTTFTIKLPRKEADVIYFDDKRRIYKESRKMQHLF